MALWLEVHGSQQQKVLAAEACSRMLERGVLHAAAGALRGLNPVAAFLAAREGQHALAGGGTVDMEIVAGQTVTTCGIGILGCTKAAVFTAKALLSQIDAAAQRPSVSTARRGGGSSAGAAGAGANTALPEKLAEQLEALGGSGLLPAIAGSILDYPVMQPVIERCLYQQHFATRDALQALSHVHALHTRLVAMGGERAESAARALAGVLTHPDVARLQTAALERLLLHAGLPGAVGALGGCTGPAGWWLLREEQQQGRLCGLMPPELAPGGARSFGMQDSAEHTAGWLEEHHCYAVRASLGVWRDGAVLAMAAAGGSAAASQGAAPPPPPPAATHIARSAALVAEALVWLCRGQGMQGAYAPAPEWRFAQTAELMALLTSPGQLPALPAEDARACLPHWVEAAAWGLTLAAEAAGAEAGSAAPPGGQTKRAGSGRAPRGNQRQASSGEREAVLARSLAGLAGALQHFTAGPAASNEEARADVAQRLKRAGLASTLDRALRLAFAAIGNAAAAAQELSAVPGLVGTLLSSGLVALVPSTGNGDSTVGGGRGQLGLLITVAKRARQLASNLDAAALFADIDGQGGSSGGGKGGKGGAAPRRRAAALKADIDELQPASTVLQLLLTAVGSMEKDLLNTLPAAQRTGGAAAAAGRGAAASATSAAPDPWVAADARCVSEAHEAYAFAARAACTLAASLARAAAPLIAASATDEALEDGLVAVLGLTQEALRQTISWCGTPVLLPAPQLLACQPHRLLAAACGLLAAAGAERQVPHAKELGLGVPELLIRLATHEHLSKHMRIWLAPPLEPAQQRQLQQQEAAVGAAATAAEALAAAAARYAREARGCLTEPIRAVLPVLAVPAPQRTGVVVGYLKTVALMPPRPPSLSRCAGGDFGDDGDGDGGHSDAFFRDTSGFAVKFVLNDLTVREGLWVPPLLTEELAAGNLPDASVAVAAPLPPPYPLAANPAAALRRVRVCANPACAEFGRAAEGELQLKQCEGCRAVRYCGAACQRAHWPAVHRGECKQLTGK